VFTIGCYQARNSETEFGAEIMTISTTKDKAATASKTVKSASKTPIKMVAKPTAKSTIIAAEKSAPLAKPANATDPVLAEPDLKKKELVDLVVERSGIKKKDAKPVVEAMLAVLGETIAGLEFIETGLSYSEIGRAHV